MEELTIEQKAKAYDEAIKVARKYWNSPRTCIDIDVLSELFPEIRELDDEEIRKGIIEYLEQSQFGEEHYQIDDDIVRNYIVWLDKQRERKPTMLELCKIEHIEHGKFYYCIKDYYDAGNKIASKGDVIQALKGTSIMGLGVRANEYFIPVYKIIQESASWSEEDEKMIEAALQFAHEYGRHGLWCWLKSLKDRVQPQPKQEWSKKDESMLNFIKIVLDKYKNDAAFDELETTLSDCLSWFRDIKSRVCCEASCTATKEWSEEDKNLLKLSLENLTELKDRFGEEYGKVGDCIVWHESLKDRFTCRPSEEEMKALEFCIEHNIDKDGVFGSKVVKLYEKLKKLMEE